MRKTCLPYIFAQTTNDFLLTFPIVYNFDINMNVCDNINPKRKGKIRLGEKKKNHNNVYIVY